MTEAQAVEAVLEAWKAGWAALHPADVPYTEDNEAFTAPTTWARITIVHSFRQQITLGPIGSRRYEHRGQIAVQLFGDIDRGRLQLSTLADDVRKVLEGVAILVGSEALDTYGGTTREQPTDGRWNQSTVVIPFKYYEVR